MTVKDLIAGLKKCNPEHSVDVAAEDRGFTIYEALGSVSDEDEIQTCILYGTGIGLMER